MDPWFLFARRYPRAYGRQHGEREGEVGAVGRGRIHNIDSFKSATWRTLMEVGG